MNERRNALAMGNVRLIYLYMYENALFGEIEINFTDEYIISINRETKAEIVVERNTNGKNYGSEIYSVYVLGISALVGKNGIGKTTLLNCIGMQDVETSIYYKEISYFMLYEIDGRWYIETKEGKQKIGFLENRDSNAFSERHWQRVEYDKEKKIFIGVYDKSWDFIVPSIQEEYDQVKFLYYKDDSIKQMDWVKDYGNEIEEQADYLKPHSTIERIVIKNVVHDIYYFMTHKLEMLHSALGNDRDIGDIGGILVLNTSKHQLIQWDEYDEKDCGKTFIIQLLFNLCTGEYKGGEKNKIDIIKSKLIGKGDGSLPVVSDYEYFKDELIDIYSVNYPHKRSRLETLVMYLEIIDYKYYYINNRIYVKNGKISGEIISFNVTDEFNSEFYKMLECMSKFNDELISYQLFSYQYNFLSAGEAKCIDIFSGVYQSVIRNEECLKNKNLILLLDEPDKGMHPELARKFISILNDFSEELGEQYNCTFQYIISTHSPFLLLDVPEVNIHRMKIQDERTIIENGERGIMSNVIDLMKDTFFLDSLFGELSESFFRKLQQEILELKEDVSEERINYIRNRIAIINEPSLKKYLHEKLESRLESQCSKENMIAYYQRKIEELKND